MCLVPHVKSFWEDLLSGAAGHLQFNVLPVALELFQNAHCERGHGVCMPGSTLYAPYEETHFSYCVSYGCRCTP